MGRRREREAKPKGKSCLPTKGILERSPRPHSSSDERSEVLGPDRKKERRCSGGSTIEWEGAEGEEEERLGYGVWDRTLTCLDYPCDKLP